MTQSIAGIAAVEGAVGTAREESGWQALKRLRWFTTLIPASGVFFFETIRHTLLEHTLPTWEGNITAGLLALALAFTFSEVVLKIVARLHQQSLADQEELVSLNAVVQERERLSRELHDGLAQIVSYLLLRLDTVEELIRGRRAEEAQAELAKLRGLTDDLYSDVRESISGLRSRVIELGLERALEEYVGEFEERHGIAVTFSAPPSVKMPPSVELQLFRIVQEALANVRKHSGASHAEVSITIPSSGVLQLIISDNGCGFDTIREESSRPGSFGLKGMRERAENLGGTSRYESEPGRGTRVIVDVPIRGRSARQYETLAPAAR